MGKGEGASHDKQGPGLLHGGDTSLKKYSGNEMLLRNVGGTR